MLTHTDLKEFSLLNRPILLFSYIFDNSNIVRIVIQKLFILRILSRVTRILFESRAGKLCRPFAYV